MPVKIIFIEDDMELASFVVGELKNEGYEVEFSTTLAAVREMIVSCRPDILILDLEVGATNSMNELPYIHSQFPSLPIIIASSHIAGKEMAKCYEKGVNHYIKKPYDIDEMLLHIRRLIPSEEKLSAQEIAIGKYKLNIETNDLLYKDNVERHLAPKEFQLLYLLLSQKGKTVRREDILKQIWGNEDASESLNNYAAFLRKYLSKDPSIHIEAIRMKGYRLSID